MDRRKQHYYTLASSRIIPCFEKALFWLDGSIVTIDSNYYFIDKSGNARHFLITGYDFDIFSGFPYKSAAFISAPAGDATLIASDVNNFLYDAGGSPNQIPVVSLFQNIDYANKLFCKHVTQTVNAIGVETYEPYVSNIVLYKDALTNAELASANAYYNVPEKLTSNIREVGAGKTYATVTAAITAASAGDTIYVYTGVYNENGSQGGITITKNVNITGLGRVYINPTGTYPMYLSGGVTTEITVKGLYINGSLSSNTIRNDTSVSNINFERLYINAQANALFNNRNNNKKSTLKECIVLGQVEHYNNVDMNTCYFTGKAQGLYIQTNYTFNVLNCKVNALSGGVIRIEQNCTLTLKGSKFTNQIFSSAPTGKYTCILTIESCQFYRNIDIRMIRFENGITTVNINNCIFTESAGTYTNNPVVLYKCDTVTFTNNTVNTSLQCLVGKGDVLQLTTFTAYGNTFYSTANVGFVVYHAICDIYNNSLTSTGATAQISVDAAITVSSVKINYNRISSQSTGSLISLGSLNSASDAKITSSEIKGNYCGSNSLTAGVHNIFIMRQTNCIAAYNYVKGGFGFVVKSVNGSMDGTVLMYNLIEECEQHIIVRGARNVKLYNNTLVSTTKQPSNILGIANHESEPNSDCSPIYVQNNIFVNTSNAGKCIDVETDETMTGSTFNNNLYYYTGSATFGFYNGSAITLAAWVLLGFDVDSLTDNPELSNFIPDNKIEGGASLGTDYNDGLDVSTVIPTSIVAKQQNEAWQLGAFVL